MNENKSKPTKIEYKRYFDGKFGRVFYFYIEFEDGVSGQFSTTKEKQEKFEIGREVTYTVSEKESKNGNVYYHIDLAKEKFSDGKGVYKSGGKSRETESIILASVCLDMANVVAEKMGLFDHVDENFQALHALADKFYDYIVDKAGNDTQLRINYQSRLKEVCKHFFAYPKLQIENSSKLLEFVDREVAYLQSKSK